MRKAPLRIGGVLVALFLPFAVLAIDASPRYRSPRNPERTVRRSTDLIVLHTTEAPANSSLNKLSDRGEAHYCVTEEGQVFAIVDRDREAFHAGRSMWNGREDVDKFSIGIECVGYHDKPMSSVQLTAIRALVRDLKAMYRLSDDRVVCHSHVAYGAPNKWHRCRHRGRKRCGMLFAMPSVRRALGLKSRPAYDPDTRARRLTNADPYLASVLYSHVDTMAGRYSSGAAIATKSAATVAKKPAATPRPAPTIGKKLPSVPRSIADLRAMGYTPRGTVSKGLTALMIVGERWKSPTTYYTIRDKVISGASIIPTRIEAGMVIWLKKH